jgi:hypothetical protein
MKKAIIIVSIVVGFSTIANASIVQLDLFDLGCPRQYDFDNSTPDPLYWKSEFDLGVTFTEITNVYMDWAGEITAGLAVYDYDPENPFPLDAGVMAYLGRNPYFRGTKVYGGENYYPAPEPFDSRSDFELTGSSTWSDLFDGQGAIGIEYTEYGMLFGRYIEHGSVVLDRAILEVEGTIVPEPATIILFSLGSFLVVNKHKNQLFGLRLAPSPRRAG